MNDTDRAILELLQENARQSDHDVAEKLGLSEATVHKSIRKLKKNGTILRFVPVLNAEKMSGHKERVQALIEVRTKPQERTGYDRIAHRIAKYDDVVDHYLISGTYDFLVVVEGNSLDGISRFVSDKLASIEHIQSTVTHFIMRKYKENGVLLQDQEHLGRLPVSP